jgi:hypothetical protein
MTLQPCTRPGTRRGISPSSRRRAGWVGARGSGARDHWSGSQRPAYRAQDSVAFAPSSHRRRRPRSRTASWSAGQPHEPSTADARGNQLGNSRLSRSAGRSRRAANAATPSSSPDLAVWLKRSGPPVAVVAESGGRREDRQQLILEGWRDAIQAGRYAAVRYDCASASVTRWITRWPTRSGLSLTRSRPVQWAAVCCRN